MSRHAAARSARHRRGLPRWLKATVVSLLVVANLAVLGVWWTIRTAESAFRSNAVTLDDVVPELAARPTEDAEPLYFLLIGSDSREDRKSTRLNSSHVKISYAVFCLKKKIRTVLTEEPTLP